MAIHFLRPYWLLMMVPMGYLCWCFSKRNAIDNWRHICDAHLLPHLLIQPKHKLTLPLYMLALGLFISILALAGPSWRQQSQPIYRSLQGTILALDLSASMLESIGSSTKIDRARFKMLDYLSRQKAGLTGLLVFTDEAHIISPLTEDNRTISNFVPALHPNIMQSLNSDSKVGLGEAKKLFSQANVNHGDIVLITDKVTNFRATQQLAQSIAQSGYRLNVFSITKPTDPNNKALENIAKAGGGKLIRLTPGNQDIDLLLATTQTFFLPETVRKTNQTGLFWHDDGRWLIFFVLPLALMAFRKGYF